MIINIRFSLPWWERVRERGFERRSPSPVSSPIKGEERTETPPTHILVCFSYSTAWGLVEGHKFFLTPGEFPQKLEQLLSESKAGKQVQLIGGVAPSNGYFVPLSVKVR